jgi:hypothetical protein
MEEFSSVRKLFGKTIVKNYSIKKKELLMQPNHFKCIYLILKNPTWL